MIHISTLRLRKPKLRALHELVGTLKKKFSVNKHTDQINRGMVKEEVDRTDGVRKKLGSAQIK